MSRQSTNRLYAMVKEIQEATNLRTLPVYVPEGYSEFPVVTYRPAGGSTVDFYDGAAALPLIEISVVGPDFVENLRIMDDLIERLNTKGFLYVQPDPVTARYEELVEQMVLTVGLTLSPGA